jgi:hypothetical protein
MAFEDVMVYSRLDKRDLLFKIKRYIRFLFKWFFNNINILRL